ncbi:MAG TPA: DUF2844 domain-containing protein [Terriglobales bacterium]|nr:DUF2844 domain-containing protein [Terriglobales bacterium]
MKKILLLKFVYPGVGTVAAMLLFCLPALAVLGGDQVSIRNDEAKMRASTRVVAVKGYNVHEIQIPSGTTVREFVSPAGKVFGVTWHGPLLPDLRQLLGDNFSKLEAAQRNRRGHGPLVINEPGFVYVSSGHMRAFTGRAYIPQLVPQGVLTDAIQ